MAVNEEVNPEIKPLYSYQIYHAAKLQNPHNGSDKWCLVGGYTA